MATTDITLEAHRPLASFAWDLRQKYSLNRGVNKQEFMTWYDLGEIELSTVYENLFVATRNKLGKSTLKESAHGYDFVKVFSTQKRILGDMKTGVLQKDGDKRRFVIGNVENKIGNIYAIGWNWMTEKPNFFCIPPDKFDGHPKCGYKIPVCPSTGKRTGGWYNDNCAYDTWEQMVMVG